jgi:hypothetical protein
MGGESITWSEKLFPTAVNLFSRTKLLLFIQVAPQLSSRDWVDPVPDTLLLANLVATGIESGPSKSVARLILCPQYCHVFSDCRRILDWWQNLLNSYNSQLQVRIMLSCSTHFTGESSQTCTVARLRFPAVDVIGSRTVTDLSYQILTEIAHNWTPRETTHSLTSQSYVTTGGQSNSLS